MPLDDNHSDDSNMYLNQDSSSTMPTSDVSKQVHFINYLYYLNHSNLKFDEMNNVFIFCFIFIEKYKLFFNG